MTKNIFSVPVFFIMLRETMEAGIVVSILLTFVSQLTRDRVDALSGHGTTVEARGGAIQKTQSDEKEMGDAVNPVEVPDLPEQSAEGRGDLTNPQLLRKLRIQIWGGAIVGFLIAIAIGGAFIGVFYSNKVHNLWAKSEDLWEGTFSLIASFIILIMGIAFLRLEQSMAKWKIKLAHAFQKTTSANRDRGGRTSRYALFILPLITVLREGLEAVLFASGVAISESASSIPLAVVVGLLCGAILSYLIYTSTSRLTLHFFLIVSTSILLLVGAGLFSTACGRYQKYVYIHGVGSDVSEAGNGPGSYDVHGNVWHLTYGNTEGGTDQGGGWSIFQAILGWTNNATLGTILCYCFYWITVICILVYMKWSEGRTTIFGLKSRAWHERQASRQRRALEKGDFGEQSSKTSPEGGSLSGPAERVEIV